jgi:hypothetical protein
LTIARGAWEAWAMEPRAGTQTSPDEAAAPAGRWLHRLSCAAFPVVTGLAWAIAAAPWDVQGRCYAVLHLALTGLLLTAWAADRGTRADAAWVLGAGTAARIALVGIPAFTSHDAVRYVWDGAVLLAGLDPWRVVPDDPRLAPLAAAWMRPVDCRDVPTVYPPGAVGAFALAALAGPARAALAWQGIATLAGIATVLLTALALAATGRTRHLALVSLSPLLVLETGVGAHADALASLAVAAALLAAERGAPGRAGAALGAGMLAKLLPGAAIVPLAARARTAGGAVRPVLAFAAVAGGGYLLALALGLRPLGSLFHLVAVWRFGSPLFSLLAGIAGERTAGVLAALVTALVLALAAVVARAGRWRAAMVIALAAPLMSSPVVFPWYLVPLVPAVALAPSAAAVAWLSALPLTYEVNDRAVTTGEWAPATWPLVAIGAAVAAGAAVDLRRRLRGR